MSSYRRLSVAYWRRVLGAALEDAARAKLKRNPRKLIARLNEQHRSIRSWELGPGASATTEPTDSGGLHLLP